MAARRVWAWAHVLRALAGEEMPLTRDTAGARHPGISRGGVLYRRAKLVCAARRKRANTPCAAARSPLALRPLPPKGRRSFWFKGFPRAVSDLYSPLPAQHTRAEGREGGLLDTICLPWLARSAVARPRGWLAGIRLYISAAAAAWRARGQRRRTGAGAATVCAALA